MVKHYQGFAWRVVGGSHEKANKPCQDFAEFRADGALTIAAVSDGHGEANCFRSDKGARFAVDCAVVAIQEFVERYQPEADEPARERTIGNLVRRVAQLWQEKVKAHYEDLPFTVEELSLCDEKHRRRFEKGEEQNKAYGATLIAAAVAGAYWFGFHVGDGRLTVLRHDGTFAQPVPWDESCFLNITTSICDMDANDRPRVHCALTAEAPPPAAIFLCSDGIDDNYPVEDNERHLYRLYAKMALTFAADGFDSACAQIEGLCKRFAREGKGDDTSLAVIVDMERLRELAPNLKTWLEREEREQEQAARERDAREQAAREREQEAARICETQGQAKKPAAEEAAQGGGKPWNGEEAPKARKMGQKAGQKPTPASPAPKKARRARFLNIAAKLLVVIAVIAVIAALVAWAFGAFPHWRVPRESGQKTAPDKVSPRTSAPAPDASPPAQKEAGGALGYSQSPAREQAGVSGSASADADPSAEKDAGGAPDPHPSPAQEREEEEREGERNEKGDGAADQDKTIFSEGAG
ncbi:MAG: protein phosphatase 2C domain-containing protein [Zoogloeaceae bacterium]|jgi:serine/threonine protein phosphatase PrpC|nr:protein phosphatase 2C domain-containing protein [Zoogloeaceae bacterium]